jgi:HNH endonuclease
MLTHARLKELLSYDPKTGIFTWNIERGLVRPGTTAGTTDHEGYVQIHLEGKKYRAHRLAYFYMTQEWPPHWMDHINRNRSDNRWVNLRPVTERLNYYNTSDYRNNTSGVKGVHWNKRISRWVAKIGAHKAYFDKFEDAVRTRKHWEAEFMKGNYSLSPMYPAMTQPSAQHIP